MVKEIKKKDNLYFQCEECGLLYKDKKIAEKCQNWCRQYKSCNLEIIKYALIEAQDEQSEKK